MADPNLTPALAQQNPKAYLARFNRLSPGERSALVASLAPTAYFHHARALGEDPAVHVMLALTAQGELDWFEVSFGGLRAKREQQGWPDAHATLREVLDGLPSGVPVVADPLVPAEPALAARLCDEGFAALGWRATGVHLSTSDLTDGGRVRFAFAAAVVTLDGETGSGALRGHAGLAGHELSRLEPAWAAFAAERGLSWRRT